MSINAKEETQNNQDTMSSGSNVQETSEFFIKNHDEEDSKKQLAYADGTKSLQKLRIPSKVPTLKDQMEASMKLLQFVADSQLTLTQINGQRKLGPPPEWTGPPPGPKCEIFVGSIPRNYYEPEIVFIFSSVGKIYELRLMMDFSGANRGYCFIMYTTEEEAARAIKELDQYEIYPGKRIGVVASINNCRLYISQLPKSIDTAAIVKRIYEITDDVDKVSVYRNANGFVSYALVSYKTHRGAAMGRRRLVPESMTLFKNHEVNVEWANPNVAPSNVYEETGTCDEHGNVHITKIFIEPMKTKKVAAQTKYNLDRRNNQNNYRTQNPFDPTIKKGRPIKAAKENFSKNLDRSIDQYTSQKCPSKYSLPPHQATTTELAKKQHKMKDTWDINGNLRNTLDKSLLHKNMKKSLAQKHDSSNAILPSISTFLSKTKHLNQLKLNDVRRSSENAFRALENIQNFAKNLPHASRDFCKYKIGGPCQCRIYLEDLNSSESSSTKSWNPVNSLVPNFSEVLNLVNENDGKNCNHYEQRNIYKNDQPIRAENISNANSLFGSQPSNSQFANYYEDYVGGSSLNHGNFSNGIKTTTMGQNPGLCVPGSLSNEVYPYEPQTIMKLSNDFIRSNNLMINSQNSPDSFVRTSTFDDKFFYGYPMNYVVYPKDIFAEDRLQFGENFRRI